MSKALCFEGKHETSIIDNHKIQLPEPWRDPVLKKRTIPYKRIVINIDEKSEVHLFQFLPDLHIDGTTHITHDGEFGLTRINNNCELLLPIDLLTDSALSGKLFLYGKSDYIEARFDDTFSLNNEIILKTYSDFIKLFE